MMQYYLDNNSRLRNTLDNGLSVIFMFEGGSDNYREYGSTYTDSANDIRNQSVVIVVQKNAAGDAYVDFWAENCSSIPGDPDWCTGEAYTGSTTILDGIYPFYTTNHTGPYAALQLDMSATNGYAYYTPSWDLDGFKNGASGINVHTRAENIAAGKSLGYAWSEGCQVISSGPTSSSNYFNEFMQSVTGISWNPWIDYYAGNLNSFAYTGTHMGYYVVDRQLGLTNPSGTDYGSGSFKLEGSGTGQYRGDITGIAAKALSETVYVAAAYKNGGKVWISGVLGYSIGAYCGSQISKGGTIADLAMATAVYGYHAKAYFG